MIIVYVYSLKLSLETRDFSMHKFLEEIVKKIVIKCNGLPALASKAIGGLIYDGVKGFLIDLNKKLVSIPHC